MKKSLLILLCILPFILTAQLVPQLSEKSRFSLITAAPGEPMYSTFGHSALHLTDQEHGIDRCYNFGTFDFEQPNFLLKFCQGRLLYFLDIESYRSLQYGYQIEQRQVREQVLMLDQTQRQRLFDLLQNNALEQNRYYQYEFFYDNCATRIRDVLISAFDYQIVFDSTGLPIGKSMRQLLHPYLQSKPWTRFGIDLVLGMPADRIAATEDFMFLPDHLHDIVGRSKRPDGAPLVLAERFVPDPPYPEKDFKPGVLGSPLIVVCLIVFLGLVSMANPRTAKIFDTLFWFVLGLAGLVMFLLWFATDHTTTKMNWNLAWALPTHLLFFWRSRQSEWVDNYFMASGMLAALVLLLWAIIPQQLPNEAIPIALLVVVKALLPRFVKRD